MLALGLCVLVGFLLGSIPTAYLLVRRRHGLDIHQEGSGNVGANNALRSSGSRVTGVLVLLGDALKGAVTVPIGWHLGDGFYRSALLGPSLLDLHMAWSLEPLLWCPGLTLLGAIAGHNYNPWLSFRAGHLVGGKGLATAAGGFLILMPGMVAVWVIGFAAGFFGFTAWKRIKSSIPGNVAGTMLVPVVGAWTYGADFGLLLLGFALLVLPKHVAQMRTLLHEPQPTPSESDPTAHTR